MSKNSKRPDPGVAQKADLQPVDAAVREAAVAAAGGEESVVPVKALSQQKEGEGQPGFAVVQPPSGGFRNIYPGADEEPPPPGKPAGEVPEEEQPAAEAAPAPEEAPAAEGEQQKPQAAAPQAPGNRVFRGTDMAKNTREKLLAHKDSFGSSPFRPGAGEDKIAVNPQDWENLRADPESPVNQFKLVDHDPATGSKIFRHPVSSTELHVPGDTDIGGDHQITVRPAGPRSWGSDPMEACQRLEKTIEKMPQLNGQAWITKDNGVVVEDVTPDEARRVYSALLAMGFRDKSNGVGWENGVPKIGKPAEGVVRPPKWSYTWPATLTHEDGGLTAEWSAVDAGKPGAKLVIRFGGGKPKQEEMGLPGAPGKPGTKKQGAMMKATKSTEEEALALLELELGTKHYGPGNHPDGSPQTVHGQRGGQAAWRRQHGVNARGEKVPQYADYSDPEDEDLPDPEDPREQARTESRMKQLSDEVRKEKLTPHFPAGTLENEFEAGLNQLEDMFSQVWTDGKKFYGSNVAPSDETKLRGVFREMGFDVFAAHGWAGDNRVLTRKSDGATATIKFKTTAGLRQMYVSFTPGKKTASKSGPADLAEETALLAELAAKHYGPGPHASGSSQEVHGGDSNGNAGQVVPQQTPKPEAVSTSGRRFDLVGAIMDWEDNNLDEEAEDKLFQYLIDTGIIDQLQGAYGRQAERLLGAGRVHMKGARSGNAPLADTGPQVPQMARVSSLTPAYGRDYKSKAGILADWNAGKDFILNDMSSPWDGKPFNKQSAEDVGAVEVQLRFKRTPGGYVNLAVIRKQKDGTWK